MDATISDFNGINTYTNPFNTPDGNVIHCLNLDSDTDGSRHKRAGYETYLNAPDSDEVKSLFSWTKDDGTTLFTYRASGSSLYYSVQGTGDWTLAGGGTITDGAHVGYAVLDNTLIVGDSGGTPRYTTDGINFSPIAAAPVGAEFFTEYQGRIYAAGTTSFLFYSTTGTASDWTSDSSSILIGGPGKLGAIFKASDRLVTTKNSGYLHRWDGDTLVDMATRLGPSSPYSVADVEDFRFWINRYGIFTSNANKPQLISNPIQRQIFNHDGSGIVGSVFDMAPAGVNGYDYMVSVGTVKDNFTGITIPDAVIVYDYKHNEFIDYQYYDKPTSFHQFNDASRTQTFIFGDATGQCYEVSDDYDHDNGHPITSSLIVLLHGNLPHLQKDFGYLEVFASPGCKAKVQFAIQNVVVSDRMWYSTGPKIWKELGDLSGGYTLFRMPPETRGRLLYLKIYEALHGEPHEIYSIHYTYEPIGF